MPATKPTTESITSNAAKAQFPFHVERYVCPGCDADIPEKQWTGKLEASALVRVVTVHCPACNNVYRARQMLEGGVWHSGEIDRLTNARDVAAARRGIAERNGSQFAA